MKKKIYGKIARNMTNDNSQNDMHQRRTEGQKAKQKERDRRPLDAGVRGSFYG
jgi:hypothetical protein